MTLFGNRFFATDETAGAPIDVATINSVEEADKFLEQLRNEPEEAPAQDTAADTSAPEEIQEQEQTPPEEVLEEKQSEVTPEKDTAKPFVLTDEILSTLTDDEKRALDKYKGKEVNDIIKALANSQLQIGKLSNEKRKEQKEQLFKQETPKPATDIQQYRREKILSEIKDILPSEVPLPENIDMQSPEFVKWYNDHFYDNAWQINNFVQALQEKTKSTDELLSKRQYLVDNRPQLLETQLDDAVKNITTKLGMFGIKPEDFGIDLKRNEEGDIPALYEVIFGEHKDKVLEYAFGDKNLSFINPDALSNVYLEKILPELWNKKLELEKKAAIQAVKKPAKELPKTPPTLGNASQQKKSVTVHDVGKANDLESLNALLEQIKQQS
jgi:hypothetical protein